MCSLTKTGTLLMCLLAWLLAVPAATSAQTCQPASPQILHEIEAVIDRHVEGHVEKDAEKAAEIYADTTWIGHWLGPKTTTRLKEVDANTSLYESGGGWSNLVFTTETAVSCGASVYTHGAFTGTLKTQVGSQDLSFKTSFYWEKGGEGRWVVSGFMIHPAL